MGDQGSAFEWRRKGDRLSRVLERAEDSPWTCSSGAASSPTRRSDGCTRRGSRAGQEIQENVGRSYNFGFEARALREGEVVECRVDPGNRKRVLLVAPEPNRPVDQGWCPVSPGAILAGMVPSAHAGRLLDGSHQARRVVAAQFDGRPRLRPCFVLGDGRAPPGEPLRHFVRFGMVPRVMDDLAVGDLLPRIGGPAVEIRCDMSSSRARKPR